MAHPRMTDQDLLDQLAMADRDQLRLILEHGIQPAFDSSSAI